MTPNEAIVFAGRRGKTSRPRVAVMSIWKGVCWWWVRCMVVVVAMVDVVVVSR